MNLELEPASLSQKAASQQRKLVVLLLVTVAFLVALLVTHWVLVSVSNVQLVDSRQVVRAQMDGPVRITVKEGEPVVQRQVLVQINTPQYKLALEEEELRLTQTESLLPPGYAALGNALAAQGAEDLYAETTAGNLKKMQILEKDLKGEVETASMEESRAALEERRLRGQMEQAVAEGRGEELRAAIAEAEKRHEACRRNTVKVKFALEEASLARATIEHENRRITRMQQENMTSQIPEATRIDMYALQKARRDMAKDNYEAASVTSPYSGVVEFLYVKNGDMVTIGEPVMRIAPTHHYTLTVTARTKRLNLPEGKLVSVTVPGYADEPFTGTIMSIIPDDSISGIVWLDSWLPESLRTVRLMVEVPIQEPGPVLPEGAGVQLSLAAPKIK